MSLSDRLKPEWRHTLFLAYVVAMILVFLVPTPETGIEWSYIDKAVHFVLFLGFAVVFYVDRRIHPARVFLASAVFAAGVELVQWVLPYREVELADFIAGAAGAALASVVLFFMGRRTTSDTAG